MYAALDSFDPLGRAGLAAALPAEELYDAWCAARDEALLAYEAWCTAPWAAKAEAHAVYVAAFDREVAATELYRHSLAKAA